MRAIVIHAAGDLRVETREPDAPGPGQVCVRVGIGGICGSDLHYYNHGGFGTVRLKEPMILGHEVAGTVAALGPGVDGLAVGDPVAVNPSRPCGHCRYCLAGLANHCVDMRFYGSAMRVPHVQGGFRDALVCDAVQCVPGPGVDLALLAMAEPFAVALHSVARAGSLLGKRVLVTGSGPIGALVVAAARHAGASEIVATDVVDAPLAVAARLGAHRTINAADAMALAHLAEGKGTVDVLFECSGNERAMRNGLDTLRPRGTLVQVGIGGDVSLPQNLVVAKELSYVGSFRFDPEFVLAVQLIRDGRVDLRPLVTATYPAADAKAGFEAARDRGTAMKVQLAFG